MVIATFGPTTGWVGKPITFENEVFTLEGYGPITAADVMGYDRQGHLLWPSEEMRAWCAQRAGVAPTPPVQAGPVTPESTVEADRTAVESTEAAAAAPDAGRCASCSAELAPDFRFCPYCGAGVEAPS